MTRTTRGSHKTRENRTKYVASAFESGFDRRRRIIGLHGTSIEAVLGAIQTGVFTGNTDPEHEKGKFSFYALKPIEFNRGIVSEYFAFEEAKKHASIYAESCAHTHFLLQHTIGLTDSGDVEKDLRSHLNSMAHFRRHKIPVVRKQYMDISAVLHRRLDDHLEHLIDLSLKRQGVILALDKKILGDYKVGPGDCGEGDVYIVAPDGLPLRYVEGIEPKGDEEFGILEAMQNS